MIMQKNHHPESGSIAHRLFIIVCEDAYIAMSAISCVFTKYTADLQSYLIGLCFCFLLSRITLPYLGKALECRSCTGFSIPWYPRSFFICLAPHYIFQVFCSFLHKFHSFTEVLMLYIYYTYIYIYIILKLPLLLANTQCF